MANEGQFQKGQSGNPGGRPKDRIWRDAVMRAVKRQAAGEDVQALEKLADALVIAGRTGDVSALREIGDRLDGKAVQALANEDGGPLQISIIRFTGDGA